MKGHLFLDASFWIAYRDERQELHSQARQILIEVFRRRLRIVTTLPVLCKTHAHFSRNTKKKRLILEDLWNNPIVNLEAVTHQDQEDAIGILQSHADKAYSLCDATSFVIMRRLGLRQVLTFDDHFRQFGEFEIIS
ncbi:MAG: PIN domain-containing protein [Verrucomicrobiota bacterium]|nr:PIN domain-containing protein [Verrucomicrobiota bacterium]